MKSPKQQTSFYAKIVSISVIIYQFIFPPKAHAYIDPGSTNYVSQVVLAFLFGIGVTVKSYWGKILQFIDRISHPNTRKDEVDE